MRRPFPSPWGGELIEFLLVNDAHFDLMPAYFAASC